MGRWKDEFLKPQSPLTEEELEAWAEANEARAEARREADAEAAEVVAEACSDADEHDPQDPDHEHGGEG